MGTLVFICPATGREVFTGIEMDLPTLIQLDLARVWRVYCPHCREPHEMIGIEHWVSELGPVTPPEETPEAA
jgi:hypothetical protein